MPNIEQWYKSKLPKIHKAYTWYNQENRHFWTGSSEGHEHDSKWYHGSADNLTYSMIIGAH